MRPGTPGHNELHATFFDAGGAEAAVASAKFRMGADGGASASGSSELTPRMLDPGHFVADTDLVSGHHDLVLAGTGADGSQFTARIDLLRTLKTRSHAMHDHVPRHPLMTLACAVALIGGLCANGSAAAPQPGAPIRIGAVFPIEGSAAPLARQELRGVQLAIDFANEDGGIGAARWCWTSATSSVARTRLLSWPDLRTRAPPSSSAPTRPSCRSRQVGPRTRPVWCTGRRARSPTA